MKKLSAIVFLTLFCSMGLMAQKKDPCGFFGKFNGVKVKSFQCGIERAGSSPYLLMGISYDKKNWMVDVSGISNKIGMGAFNISFIPMEGKKMLPSYHATFKHNVQQDKKNPKIFGIIGNFEAKNGKNEVLKIEGIFAWESDVFQTQEVAGTLNLQVGDKKIQAKNVKLAPWNDGFQISEMNILKPGETMTVKIDVPSLNPGKYQKPKAKFQLIYAFMENKQLKTELPSAENLNLAVLKSGGKTLIKIQGKIRLNQKMVDFNGEFKAN